MRLLVLGGTVFLSHAVAAAAVARGHEVVCAARGVSGRVPDGARLEVVDRGVAQVPEGPFDAVLDVTDEPEHVRRALAVHGREASDAHWVFVSTVSTYVDQATPGQTPATGAVHPGADLPADDPAAYGPRKVLCEQLVTAGAVSSTVVRPGLVVGPGDPSGRFAYWPSRLDRAADGEPVLAPGDPADVVQVIDVRDLAEWLVTLAETRRTGTYDGVGPLLPLGEALDLVAEGCGARPTWRWTASDDLERLDVRPWSGLPSLPLWLPRPAYDGMLAHDPAPAAAAGLACRPLVETVRDTLAWLHTAPDAAVTGLTAAEEAAVLAELP
ncbi:NAD-dependent epimerase/dehydratase family protein [Nocardioides alkalitolerans]|uniref:NAD-dependent epimerase/dehydratase family protein n=1 Tax=Nocardioides alkalitolerans TaxID=281714 RepID=UPI00048BEF60|nr:NAD-dependent epimerase/dehydratase family protein [Nocardioides alkalitolerans]